MKLFFLIVVLILSSTSAFAFDAITTLVGGGTLLETTQYAQGNQGDIWLKFHKSDRVKLDFDYYFTEDLAKINVAQAKILIPSTDLIVGRQQMGWGVGYTVNPIDIINPRPIGSNFDPTFVRDGRDAVVLTRYLDSHSKIELVYASDFDQTTQHFDKDYAAKIKTRLFESDAAVSYIDKGMRSYSEIVEQKDKVIGLEMAGTIPEVGWGYWVEGARYMDSKRNELVLGTDYYIGDWHPVLEYYRNGFGTFDKNNYDLNLLFRGRLLGRDYLIPSCSVAVSEKLTLTGFGLLNINDSSYAVAGVYDYFIDNNLELIVMPFYIAGDSGSEYGIQKSTTGNYALQAKVKLVF